MDYQTLDNIADAYIPLLLMTALLAMAINCARDRSTIAANLQLLRNLLLLTVVAYGVMLLDQRLGLWASFGLDYSTHTAIALVLACVLLKLFPSFKYIIALSLVGYAGLMIYQRYHSLTDIVSTSIVIIGAILLLGKIPLMANSK